MAQALGASNGMSITFSPTLPPFEKKIEKCSPS